MIIPLKKITILSMGDIEKTLEALGVIGIVHIDSPLGKLKFPEHEKQIEKISKVRLAIKQKNLKNSYTLNDIENTVEKFHELLSKEEKLLFRKEFLDEESIFYKHFGKIDLNLLNTLKEKNEELYFYAYDSASLHDQMLSFNENSGQYFGVSNLKVPNEKAETLPTLSFIDIEEELHSISKELNFIETGLISIGNCQKDLDAYEKYIKNLILLKEKTKASTKAFEETEVYITTGFITEKDYDKVKNIAEQSNWAYEIVDALPEDGTPVLLKNHKTVEDIVYPFYDFMGSWPSPYGKDPSMIFAFFTIFFSAILVGDAGYGLALILTAFLTRKKFRFPFLYYLGLGCLIWGTLTGTWFGSSWLIVNTPLKHLVIPSLSSFDLTSGALNTEIQGTMGIMFIFGGIHLTIAKLLALGKKLNENLEVLGDLSLIWGMVYAVRVLMAGEKNTAIIMPLVVVGLVLGVIGVLFSKDKLSTKIGKILLKPLNLVNGFSDTMSYIRLFAVGFASLIVGMVASLIATMTGSIIAGGIILILMNTINLSLGMIAILVHAIRLNNLEFANNSGLSLGSKKFTPFKI